jgi:hypothetical protein
MKNFIIFTIWVILLVVLCSSCSVSKPVVKKFTVIKIYDGFFAAKNGKTVLMFAPQDSVYVGKIINVSIAKR